MTTPPPGDPTDPGAQGWVPPGQPQYGPPYGQQPYEQPPYGQQPYGPPQYGPPPYGQQPYGYGYPPPATGTNGLAIASLILAFFCSIAGLICGIIALNQISARHQGGRGLAIAGIVISCLSIAFGILVLAAAGVGGH